MGSSRASTRACKRVFEFRSGLDVGLVVDPKLGDEDAQKRLGLLGLALGEDVP
jgi:hypothetical protein